MVRNNILTAIFAVLVSITTATAQNPISISGSLVGLSEGDKISLINMSGETLASTTHSNGEFSLKNITDEPSLYTLELGIYKKSIFIDKDITINGRIDSQEPTNSVLTMVGTESNNEFVTIYSKIKRSVDIQYKKYVAAMSNKNDEQAATEAMELGMNMFRIPTKVLEEMKKVSSWSSAELKSAIYYMFRGDCYDSAAMLYDAMTQQERDTEMGRQLSKFMDSESSVRIGHAAPDFTINDIRGKQISLKSLRGKVVLIDFWASWCGPCRKEMPYLKAIYENLDHDKVAFISISLDDKEDAFLKANAKEAFPWTSAWSANWQDNTMRKLYRFDSIPHIIIIDQDGNYAGKGFRRRNIATKIEELLTK